MYLNNLTSVHCSALNIACITINKGSFNFYLNFSAYKLNLVQSIQNKTNLQKCLELITQSFPRGFRKLLKPIAS